MSAVPVTQPQWRSIKLRQEDNVAVVVNDGGAPAGAVFQDGIAATEAVPQGHKVALADIPAGAAVIRYATPIGYANRDIARGQWVQEDMLDMPSAPQLDALDLSLHPARPVEPLHGYSFQGYRNRDGSVGTRNILGIIAEYTTIVYGE